MFKGRGRPKPPETNLEMKLKNRGACVTDKQLTPSAELKIEPKLKNGQLTLSGPTLVTPHKNKIKCFDFLFSMPSSR
jgi:hypothetical protein